MLSFVLHIWPIDFPLLSYLCYHLPSGALTVTSLSLSSGKPVWIKKHVYFDTFSQVTVSSFEIRKIKFSDPACPLNWPQDLIEKYKG